MKDPGDKAYEYPGVLETDKIEMEEMKEKVI